MGCIAWEVSKSRLAGVRGALERELESEILEPETKDGTGTGSEHASKRSANFRICCEVNAIGIEGQTSEEYVAQASYLGSPLLFERDPLRGPLSTPRPGCFVVSLFPHVEGGLERRLTTTNLSDKMIPCGPMVGLP